MPGKSAGLPERTVARPFQTRSSCSHLGVDVLPLAAFEGFRSPEDFSLSLRGHLTHVLVPSGTRNLGVGEAFTCFTNR